MGVKRVIVVAGTSTDIGKTYVSGLLCKHIIGTGKKPLFIKPMQTGCEMYMDQEWIKNFSGADCQTIIKFKLPASPHLASKHENLKINFLDLCMSVKSLIQSTDYDYYIVELAGGLLVPIDDKYFNVDLIKKIDPGLIYLVSSPFLGTINHTLMSIETLKNREIDTKKVVVAFSHPRNIESDIEKIVVDDNISLFSQKHRVVEVKFEEKGENTPVNFYI